MDKIIELIKSNEFLSALQEISSELGLVITAFTILTMLIGFIVGLGKLIKYVYIIVKWIYKKYKHHHEERLKLGFIPFNSFVPAYGNENRFSYKGIFIADENQSMPLHYSSEDEFIRSNKWASSEYFDIPKLNIINDSKDELINIKLNFSYDNHEVFDHESFLPMMGFYKNDDTHYIDNTMFQHFSRNAYPVNINYLKAGAEKNVSLPSSLIYSLVLGSIYNKAYGNSKLSNSAIYAISQYEITIDIEAEFKRRFFKNYSQNFRTVIETKHVWTGFIVRMEVKEDITLLEH